MSQYESSSAFGGGGGGGFSAGTSDEATTSQQFLTPDVRSSGDGESGEGDIGVIFSWTANDPWTSAGEKKYRWWINGKICFFEAYMVSTVASSFASTLYFELPSDVPTPAEFSELADVQYQSPICSWRTTALGGNDSPDQNGSMRRQDSETSGWRVYGETGATQGTKVWAVNGWWRID